MASSLWRRVKAGFSSRMVSARCASRMRSLSVRPRLVRKDRNRNRVSKVRRVKPNQKRQPKLKPAETPQACQKVKQFLPLKLRPSLRKAKEMRQLLLQHRSPSRKRGHPGPNRKSPLPNSSNRRKLPKNRRRLVVPLPLRIPSPSWRTSRITLRRANSRKRRPVYAACSRAVQPIRMRIT
ncbi:MAG: hypothetical protein K0Q55_161 [Verrucomicrobia bacterium]|nr:hypothetical protein [Verrucomicrobiota bacterium]